MSTPAYILAVDGGGTKTEAALSRRDGHELARARTGPCNLYQDPAGGLAAVREAWERCGTAAGLDGRAASETCLSAGLAGVNAAGAGRRFHDAFAAFAERRLSSDGYVALVGAFEAAPGALLSIGTGVVAYRLESSGASRMLSGWGFPAGDHGGGAWLGFRLVGDWLESRDGYGALPADHVLAAAAADLVGGRRDRILDWLRRAKPGDFAALARPIVEQAAAGDAYASGLLGEAAGHHARVARALAPTPAEPLVLGGGLAPFFAEAVAKALPAGCLAHDRKPSPLHGAWLVGIGRARPEFPEPDRTNQEGTV
jgi:glucosamine kinase